MTFSLNCLLVCFIALGVLKASELETDQAKCFVQQIDTINTQRKEDMTFLRQAVSKMSQNIEEMKQLLLQNTVKSDSSLRYPLASADRNKRDVGSRAYTGAEEVGKYFITLHGKALETSTDVKSLIDATYELKYTLQNISSYCNILPVMFEEIEAIRKHQEFFKTPTSCLDLLKSGHTLSGPYTIYAEASSKEIEVWCDQDTDGGGWTVFQRRKDGSENFYRGWSDYEKGFGSIEGEFWLGNNIIHQLTAECCNELRIDMGDADGNKRYATYSTFGVGTKNSKYKLTVSGYKGNAGDSLSGHNGYPFSTKDQDNDSHEKSCSQLYKGGWWYNACHAANLNGLYLSGAHDSYADGVNWFAWLGHHKSLTFTEMKTRSQS